MLVLFDYGSALFLNGMYDEAITVFDKILNEVNSSSERSQIFISVFLSQLAYNSEILSKFVPPYKLNPKEKENIQRWM